MKMLRSCVHVEKDRRKDSALGYTTGKRIGGWCKSRGKVCYLTKISPLDVKLIWHAPIVECAAPVYRLMTFKGLNGENVNFGITCSTPHSPYLDPSLFLFFFFFCFLSLFLFFLWGRGASSCCNMTWPLGHVMLQHELSAFDPWNQLALAMFKHEPAYPLLESAGPGHVRTWASCSWLESVDTWEKLFLKDMLILSCTWVDL